MIYFEHGICFSIIGKTLDMIIPWHSSPEEITTIFVPHEVKRHRSWDIYNRFPNLQEIIAAPYSDRYSTYDGALYSKDGTLQYVPLGKTVLHLDPNLKHIEYRVFCNHDKLQQVIIDGHNEFFTVQNNCLFSRWISDNSSLHTLLVFVPRKESILFIPRDTIALDDSVLQGTYNDIVIEEGNTAFQYENGVLSKHGELLYVLSSQKELELPSNIRDIYKSDDLFIPLLHVEHLSVDIANPYIVVVNNVIYLREPNEILYVLPCAEKVFLDEATRVKTGSFCFAKSLKHVVLPLGSKEYTYHAYQLRSWIRVNIPKGITYTVYRKDGKSITLDPTPMPYRQMMSILVGEQTGIPRAKRYFDRHWTWTV